MTLMDNLDVSGLESFTVFPAGRLRRSLAILPSTPGVYLWFVRGGTSLLQATGYLPAKHRRLVSYRGHPHLYTGAATDLRFRVGQHFRNTSWENSSPRKTLLTLERIFGAMGPISGSHDISELDGLTNWLFENVFLAIAQHPRPLDREQQILNDFASPFNIAGRRRDRYAKFLMAWRIAAFPPTWMDGIPFPKSDLAGMSGLTDRQMSVATLVR